MVCMLNSMALAQHTFLAGREVITGPLRAPGLSPLRARAGKSE